MLNLFTHHVEPFFKLPSAVFRAVAVRASDFRLLRYEQVGNTWLSLARLRSQGPFIQRHLAPADGMESATPAPHRVFGNLHSTGAPTGITRQKEDANRNPPLRVEARIQAAGFASKKGGRELNHDAGAVTAGTVSVHTTAVGKVLQADQRLPHNVV